MNRFEYKNSLGNMKTGELIKVIEGQGTDITYMFKNDRGLIECVSGENLKTIRRLVSR